MNDPVNYYEEQYWDESDDHCDHSEAELDWEGRFECPCGHKWCAKTEEMDEYWKFYDRAHRPPTLWDRTKDWWYWFRQNLKRPFRTKQEKALDDDVPF